MIKLKNIHLTNVLSAGISFLLMGDLDPSALLEMCHAALDVRIRHRFHLHGGFRRDRGPRRRARRRLLANRLAVTRLCELDERALKDIGLTPSDVRAALALPLDRDPSEHLSEVAGHKRARYQEQVGSAVPIARLRARDADVRAPASQACPI